MKKILFVDDEAMALQGLKRMLRPLRNTWDMEFIDTGEEALTLLEKQRFDVVVVDMRMPVVDGPTLLNEVAKNYPATVRIVLSGQADRSEVLRSIESSHQYLAKPCDAETLKTTVARACALRDRMTDERLSFVAEMKNLPSIPEIYTKLVEQVRSDNTSIRSVAELIEQDMGMTAKILQLVNSAYFGVPRNISNPMTAVNLLGLENVSSLVLMSGVFSQVDAKKLPAEFSLDAVWRHSGSVGRLAQNILITEYADKQDSDDALSAGLLHDCGKLIFAANLGREYGEVIRTSIDNKVPLCEVEHEVLGATHAQVGAYVLKLWGLPETVVETVAFHHDPTEYITSQSPALGAVYAANVLTDEPSIPGCVHSRNLLDSKFIESLGGEAKLDTWAALQNSDKADS